MVDLRGKPPYLPKNMSYTDVLKFAIEKGLEYFGYDSETWDGNFRVVVIVKSCVNELNWLLIG